MTWPPVDSEESRELREQREALASERDRRRRDHEQRCDGGWLGETDDGRPLVCPICRPHLSDVACRTCSLSARSCEAQRDRSLGSCCSDCDHSRGGGPRDGSGSGIS